jgi:hypothetical protein
MITGTSDRERSASWGSSTHRVDLIATGCSTTVGSVVSDAFIIPWARARYSPQRITTVDQDQDSQRLIEIDVRVNAKHERKTRGTFAARLTRKLLKTQLMHVVLRNLPLQLDNTLIATSWHCLRFFLLDNVNRRKL